MKAKIIVFTLSLIAMVSTKISAQSFATPYETLVFGRGCIVVNRDGSIIKGRVKSTSRGRIGLKALCVIDSSTNQRKYINLANVDYAMATNTKLNIFLNVMARTESIQKAQHTDFNKYFGDDYVKVVHIGPFNGKHYLGQLLNPDFSNRIKVYYAPYARHATRFLGTRGVYMAGGMIRAYFIEKDNQIYKVRKSNYKKVFEKLFSDCPELMNTPVSERKFSNMEGQIYEYDLKCR